MLLDRAIQLATRAQEYKLTNELAREAQAFATRASQLEGPVNELHQLRQLALEFAINGIDIPFDKAATLGIVIRAKEILEAFTADPKSLTEGDESFRQQFLPGIRSVSQQLKVALETGWQQRVDKELEALPQDVLTALETVSSYRAQILMIRGCDEDAKRLRSMLPALGGVATRLAALAQTVTKKDLAWQSLKGSELPDEVIDFLKQAGTHGFSLADLTALITQWLSERGLLGSFRIRSV
jgi:hypothetical protein